MFVCVSMFMCVVVCVCMWGGVRGVTCMSTCVLCRDQRTNSYHYSGTIHLNLRDRVSHWSGTIQIVLAGWLANLHQGPTCLCLPCLRMHTTKLIFIIWVMGINLRPYDCQASNFHLDISPQFPCFNICFGWFTFAKWRKLIY